MMTLYSGTTDPFSQRCRIVLHEKGMDFQIIDVDLDHKPEDLAVMNPYNQVPVLVERDLVLHESNIINEYIDERFPHPQLMPADPLMRARARLFLHRFEKELFSHIDTLEGNNQKQLDKARGPGARQSAADRAGIHQAQVHARRGVLDARCGDHAVAMAARLLRNSTAQAGGAAHEILGAAVFATGVYRGAYLRRTRHEKIVGGLGQRRCRAPWCILSACQSNLPNRT